MGKRILFCIVLGAFAVCAVAVAQQRKAADEARFGTVEVKRTESHFTRPAGVLVIPWHVNYQGYLTDDAGNPINDTLSMTFGIWDDPGVGSELWNENQNVVVEEGLFNVVLGVFTPIPSDVFGAGASRWLELMVEAQSLSPRTEITSVGYAYRSVKADSADEADMVDGFDASPTPGPNDLFPLSAGDVQYVNEGQVDAIDSPMIVNGTILRADVDAAFKAPYADTADYALNAPTDNDWTIAGNDMYSAVSGNVGVGTSPGPGMKLHVSGNCQIDGKAYVGQLDSIESIVNIFNADVSDWELVAAGDADRFDIREWGGPPLLSVEAGGNVGVGTSNPAERLDVNGTAQMTGFSLPTGATSGYVLTSDVSGLGTWQAAAGGNGWTITGSVLHPSADYGLSMRSSNVLYGIADSTHVNLGIACTTGTSGENYKYCTVSGGLVNTASGRYATVGGGSVNTASGDRATVGGGGWNTASANYATVGGGIWNSASGWGATVSGWNNTASGLGATVGGGSENTASGWAATVGGGYRDTVKAFCGGVLSGGLNLAGDQPQDSGAVVAGGFYNSATGKYSFVGGGYRNTASGWGATVGGGYRDTVKAYCGGVLSGRLNLAGDQPQDSGAVVAGGFDNSATGKWSFVGGGRRNTASAVFTTVSGGLDNTASADHATVGGGWRNTASGSYATVGGGFADTASYDYATVGGGRRNIASGWAATVGGGWRNTASGEVATVGGGYADTVAGDYSFAAGAQVRIGAAGDYTFAFGRNFTTSTPNAVIFHNSSNEIKVGIGETAPANILTVQQTSATDPIADAWTQYSSRRWKTNIETIPDALEKVQKLRGVYFDWKEDGQHDIGMIAEEVGEVIPEVVAYEPDGDDARSLDYARLVAVLVEAVKAQQDRIEALEAKIEGMEQVR